MLGLANRLRHDGIEALVDQYLTAPRQSWPKWMEGEIQAADFVLLVCTETYLQRVEDREQPGKGRGVIWESDLIYNLLYERSPDVQRFIPVLFAGGESSFIPLRLRGLAHYYVDTEEGYESLCRHLTNQPLNLKPKLGARRSLPAREPQSHPSSLAAEADPKPPSNPFEPRTHWENRLTRRLLPLQHRWGRILARCLNPDPVLRCANVADVAAALDRSRVIRTRGIGAVIVMTAVISGAIAYRATPGPADTIRLAVLPFETDAPSKQLCDGLLEDAADRLRVARRSKRTKMAVIPMSDVIRYRADTPEKAARVLGATHSLSGSLHREIGRTVIHCRLTDTRSRIPLKEWEAEYAQNETRYAPQALASMVAGTLGLPPLAAVASVNDAAYVDFATGTALSRQSTGVDAAIPFLERATKADPNSPLTHARLAEAQALKYELTNDETWLENARMSLRAAERRNPDLTVVLLASAMINQYAGIYDVAETDLLRALQIEPQNGDVWRRLGMVYQDNNHFAKALPAYEKAIEVQPDYFKNYRALCAFYVKQADYDKAIDQCRKMVRLTPDLWEAHFALGIPYFESGHYAEGEAEFRAALGLNPASSKVLQSLGVALFYEARYAEAIPLFRRAIKAGPTTYLLYLDLGTALQLAGRQTEAMSAYRQGIALIQAELAKNPRDGAAKSQLALLWARLNQRALAESEAAQAWQLAAGSVEVEEWLIRTYEVLGQRSRALEFARKLPIDSLRRLNRAPDLAELRQDSRFRELLVSLNVR